MYTDYTVAQLKEECKDLGLKVTAKNPGKPNKTELLAALSAHLSYEPDEDEDIEVEESEDKYIPTQSPAKLARLEMFRKDRVIIHDMQENQSKDKDEMISVSWGNRLLGGQTDFVSLNGEPQYVRRGAINNLIEATTIIHSKKAGGNGAEQRKGKRFVIEEVAGLTEQELAELATKQKMRNSKV